MQLRYAIVLSALALSVAAQPSPFSSASLAGKPDRFYGTDEDVLVGQEIDVVFTDPNRAGQTVTVTVVDAIGDEWDTLDIVLNAAGVGNAKFPVPLAWEIVDFKESSSQDWTTYIDPTDGRGVPR